MQDQDESLIRRQLLERLRRKFALVSDCHQIGERRYEFTRVSDPRVVLDAAIAAEGRGEKPAMPYWAEVWESALAVGEWLVEQPSVDLRSPVLDLGCGMGFAGMVAASLELSVLFADIEPDALLFARFNSWPWRERTIFRRLDWRRDTLDEKFPLILGADVLYERAQWEHLEPFWQRHLADDGQVLLGEPGRRTGEEFPDWIKPRGWYVSASQRHLTASNKSIRLFVLQKKNRG